jgi:chromosome segregation ATPase
MADLIPPMLIKLQADISELKTGLAQAENAIKGVDKSVQTASTGMSNFATKVKQIGASIGIAFAGTQVLQFGRDVIQQAQEAEAQQQRLYQLMKVGTGATDEQIASLNAQAEALQKVGVVTAGNITQTQSQLATFNLQTDTIKALTPAILDYVTAEKGANASADEFKQMTNGLAQALNGNFGSLTRVGFVLDDHTKKLISSGTEAERSAAIVDVLNSTYKDFNAELRNTPEGRMQVLRNDFNQLKEDLGKKLLPALKIVTDFLTDQLIPGLRALGKFFKDNSTIIISVTGAVLAGVVAWKAYQTILVVTSAVTKAYIAIQTVMKTGQLASIASTNGLAASMLKLNAIMRANPIGVIVTAIALLAAGFAIAYKKSETFRNGVATVAKAVLSFVAFMIRAWGEFITVLMKVITGPLKLFLGVMSKIPGLGNAAKAGLKLVNGAIEGVGDFAEKTANKIEGLKAKVDSFTAAANKASKAGKDNKDEKGGGGNNNVGGGGLTDEEKKKLETIKKKLEAYKKDVLDIYKSMNKSIIQAQEDAAEELEQRNEKMFKAHKDYDERVADLNKRNAETMAEADKRYNEKEIDEENRKNKTIAAATKKHLETKADILTKYAEKAIDLEKNLKEKTNDILNLSAKKKLDLETDYQKKITELRAKATEKANQLIKSASEKQLSIVKQSQDLLRNAFASKTGFDLGEAFKGGADNADKLLADLKIKLTAIKNLQSNAAMLAGRGYSQVFIQEVVKQGPEAGNKIAEALKAASPEATLQLQDLYNNIENVSKHGLDSLAEQMSTSTSLATEELFNAYQEVGVELKEVLSNLNDELNANLIEAKLSLTSALAELDTLTNEAIAETIKTYNEGLSEAKKTRDDNLAEAEKALKEAIAEAQITFAEAMADALKTLTETRESAQKDLNEGLAEAQKTLQETLLETQKDYEKSIDEINKRTAEKLKDLKEKLAEIAALMNTTQKGAGGGVVAGAPSFGSISIDNSKDPANILKYSTSASERAAAAAALGINITNNIDVTTTTSAADIANAIMTATKYGLAVT